MALVALTSLLPAGVGYGLLRWLEGPPSRRELADDFKTTPRRYRAHELAAQCHGQYLELGLDQQTRQRVILPAPARFLNTLLVGPTGVGKSAYLLSTGIAGDIAHGDNCVIVFDSQGDLTEPVLALCRAYGRQATVLPAAGFNPLNGPGSADDRAALVANLYVQTADLATEGNALYYRDQTSLFVRQVVPLYERAYHQPMILRELSKLALSAHWREQLVHDAGACREAADYLEVWARRSEGEIQQTLSSLVAYLDKLTAGTRRWHYNQREAPTLAERIDRQEVLVIREGGSRGTLGHALGQLLLVSLQEYAARRDILRSPHPIFLYLDEVPLYLNAQYPDFLATSRKRRIAQTLGAQNLAQLGEARETLLTNCRTWLVHNGLLAADAMLVADEVGKRLFILRSQSQTHTQRGTSGSGGSTQESETSVYDYIVPPHKITGLGEDEALLLTVEGRERAPHRILLKPQPLQLPLQPYREPAVPPSAPPTIWELRAAGHHTGMLSATPAPGRVPPHPAVPTPPQATSPVSGTFSAGAASPLPDAATARASVPSASAGRALRGGHHRGGPRDATDEAAHEAAQRAFPVPGEPPVVVNPPDW